jgi:7-carboxy-7-deazaguanine synthase
MRCVWCDTSYAFEGGELYPIEAILEEVRSFGCSLVDVTGGEPLAQEPTFALLARLADEGFTVLVETGGGVPIDAVDPRAILIYDVKCPDSGEEAANIYGNLGQLKPGIDEVKFVLASRRDYLWAVEMTRKHRLADRHPVLFSPVHGLLDPAELARWILEDRPPVRLQLQLHKILWGADARGV